MYRPYLPLPSPLPSNSIFYFCPLQLRFWIPFLLLPNSYLEREQRRRPDFSYPMCPPFLPLLPSSSSPSSRFKINSSPPPPPTRRGGSFILFPLRFLSPPHIPLPLCVLLFLFPFFPFLFFTLPRWRKKKGSKAMKRGGGEGRAMTLAPTDRPTDRPSPSRPSPSFLSQTINDKARRGGKEDVDGGGRSE